MNDFGLVRVNRYENQSALAVTLETWGAQLLTGSGDAGLTFGYARRTYVFPRSDGPAVVPMAALSDPSAGEMASVPCESCPGLESLGEPVLSASKVVGLSFDTNSSRVGIGFGLRYRTVLDLPSDGSQVLLLKLKEGDQRSLHVIIGKEVEGQ